jgi:DNA-directed RNA polymerase subunit F
MNYYKTIGGKKLDAGILDQAEAAVSGARDGRISKTDAQGLVKAVKDGGRITDIEKNTLLYAKKNFKWTDSASALLTKEIGKLKTTYYKTVSGQKMDGGILDVAAQAVKGSGDGRISTGDAKKILKEAKDGGRITDVERATLTHIQKKYKWTDKAGEWFNAEIAKL